MNKDEILDKTKAVVVRILELEESDVVNNSVSLCNDLGADSLDVVECIMELEKEFNISISDDDIDTVTTINSLVDLIEGKVK